MTTNGYHITSHDLGVTRYRAWNTSGLLIETEYMTLAILAALMEGEA